MLWKSSHDRIYSCFVPYVSGGVSSFSSLSMMLAVSFCRYSLSS